MFQKQKRIQDKKLLSFVRMQPCVACGRRPTKSVPNDAEHISTKGAGNHDSIENVWSLCRTHHVEKGMGLEKFLKKYPSCVEWLIKHNRTDVFERLERK